MKLPQIATFIVFAIMFSCNKEVDPYLITDQSIGLLTDSTQVKELKEIFGNDSIVNYSDGEEFTRDFNNIDVYSKEGEKLLTLTPKTLGDSTSVIESVQIFSPKFKTDKAITSQSSFKDISDNYKITKINNIINNLVLSVDELNASFTIDKEELPSNLRFNMDLNIEKSQIPDKAKIKHFFVYWN